jgi:hypothetical protein
VARSLLTDRGYLELVGGGVCPRVSIFASDTKALLVVDFARAVGAFLAGAVFTAARLGGAGFLALRASRGAPIERFVGEAPAAFLAGAFAAGAFLAGALLNSSRTTLTAILASDLVSLACSATAFTSCDLFMPVPFRSRPTSPWVGVPKIALSRARTEGCGAAARRCRSR